MIMAGEEYTGGSRSCATGTAADARERVPPVVADAADAQERVPPAVCKANCNLPASG